MDQASVIILGVHTQPLCNEICVRVTYCTIWRGMGTLGRPAGRALHGDFLSVK